MFKPKSAAKVVVKKAPKFDKEDLRDMKAGKYSAKEEAAEKKKKKK